MKGEVRLLQLLIFIFFIFSSSGRELKIGHRDDLPIYNHTLALILVEFASAAYMSDMTQLFTWTCDRCDDLTRGFEMIAVIVDVQHCLQAYVGVAFNLNAIVIAFRGTQESSIQNWVEDLYWKQLDLNYPRRPDSMVHHGFYSAYHNTSIRSGIIDAVQMANQVYGVQLDIFITGHSMGGAMAAFCALDLKVNLKAERRIKVMTFGQPRIGNAVFAAYYREVVPDTIRVTNGHDMVPHLPPYFPRLGQKMYRHFPREVWLYDAVFGSLVYPVERVCDRRVGEDPSCSRSVLGSSLSDHLSYFGVRMCTDHDPPANPCRIVLAPHPSPFLTAIDPHGNFFLSLPPNPLFLG